MEIRLTEAGQWCACKRSSTSFHMICVVLVVITLCWVSPIHWVAVCLETHSSSPPCALRVLNVLWNPNLNATSALPFMNIGLLVEMGDCTLWKKTQENEKKCSVLKNTATDFWRFWGILGYILALLPYFFSKTGANALIARATARLAIYSQY